MEWISENQAFLVLLGFMLLEKIVKVTPVKWDDILVDGLKSIYGKLTQKKLA